MKPGGRILIFCICSVLAGLSSLHAQVKVPSKAQKQYEAAQEYFGRMQFKEAEEALDRAIEIFPGFSDARMMRAEIYTMRNALDLAIIDVETVVNGPDSLAYNRSFGALANLYREALRFEDAIAVYQRILRGRKLSEETRNNINQLIKQLLEAKAIVENPVPFSPQNMGPEVNSEFSEYHPTLTVDGEMMIFTVMRPAKGGCPHGDSRMEEDFYMVRKKGNGFGDRQPLPPPVGTPCNEGAASISPDGRFLFFAADRGEETGMDIYMSEFVNGKWSKPVNLGYPVNSRHWESQPAFSSDGRTLYFVSKRPGGYGKEDIYYSVRNEDGTWSEPKNLGPKINTPGRDFSPSIHPDGVTLYFASDGHPAVGGADLFMSRIQADGKFSTPVNIGYPINTSGDERLILVAADGKTAYYASDGMQGYGRFDLYTFEMPEQVRPNPVTWFRGKVWDGTQGLTARLELIDLETGKTLVSTTAEPGTGKFLMPLLTGTSFAFHVSHPGYMFYSENIHIRTGEALERDVKLEPIRPSTEIVLRNVFFDTDKSDLKPESRAELMRLVKLLSDNPQMVIEVQGHTDNRGGKEHNMRLSQARAAAVVSFLVSQGIAESRLKPVGYGDAQPIASNDTEEGRAQNRRTQIRIIR